MAWTILRFGKYKGKTLPQVIFTDPDWFFWTIEKRAFENKGLLEMEAQEIYNKARKIKIPQTEGKEKLVVEYIIDPSTGKFAQMELVPISRPPHVGSSSTIRSDKIDMCTPRSFAHYDKFGYTIMIKNLKHYLFGNKNIRLTKDKCEYFFENDENFT